MYYLIGQSNMTLDGTINAFGYLGLISCTNITAKNSDVCGIVVVNTTLSTISNVNTHNSLNGIYLKYSSDNNFTDCDSYDNADRGISFDYSSNNNVITDCDLYDNNYGIYFKSSLNNIVKECNVYDNAEEGIHMYSSAKNNLFYHNSILRNDVNVYDRTTNIWDNGYSDPFNPITDGGNYWDDYTDVDLYHGPNQDILGSDGICDTPRVIYRTNKDDYPFMKPIGDTTPPEIKDVVMTNSTPRDTIAPFGWENVTCIVTDLEVDKVKLVVTNPDTTKTDYIMSKSGYTQYYREITLTEAGDYTYHVWANDTSGHVAEWSDEETFLLPENWDMNDDRVCTISDLRKVALEFGEEGQPGWIREDYNNDGTCTISDLRKVALCFGDTY